MDIDILTTVESLIKSNEMEELKKFSVTGLEKLRELGIGLVNSFQVAELPQDRDAYNFIPPSGQTLNQEGVLAARYLFLFNGN